MSLNLGTLFIKVGVLGKGNVLAFEKTLNRTQRTVTGLTRGMGPLGTAIAGAFAVDKVVDMADGYTEFSNRVRLATSTAEEFNTVQKGLTEIARSTAGNLEEVGLLYQKISQSSKRLGLDQESIMKTVETVSKTIALGGSNAQEAAGALRQFGQALSNDFKASSQELNSLNEQATGLSNAIAAGLGVPTSALKGMAEAGQLSAKKVIEALAKQSAAVDTEFEKVQFSVNKSMQKIETGFTHVIGTVDKMTGTSQEIAKWADEISSILTGGDLEMDIRVFIANWETQWSRFSAAIPKEVKTVVHSLGAVKKAASDLSIVNIGKTVAQNLIEFVGDPGPYLEKKAKELKAHFFNTAEVIDAGLELVASVSTGAGDGAFEHFKNRVDKSSEELKKSLQAGDKDRQYSLMEIYKFTKEYNKLMNTIGSLSFIGPGQKSLFDDSNDSASGGIFENMAAEAINYMESLKLVGSVVEKVNQQMRKDNEALWTNIEDTLGSSILTLFQGTTDGIADMWKNMIKQMAAQKFAKDLLGGVRGLFGKVDSSGPMGETLGAIGSILGFKAKGGPVSSGKPYIVGEEGPELVVPRSSGTVVPNGASTGGTRQVIFNIQANEPARFFESRGKMMAKSRGF